MTSPSILNPVLARWLDDRPELIPAVDCTACTLATERPAHRARWSSFKCCTFQPFVAGFLAGAMLEQGLNPLAIDAKKAILAPIGVVPHPGFRTQYEALSDDQRGEAQLCSYYDLASRRCRVWHLRPGECSTHFCSATGRTERETLAQTTFTIESAVAQMALVYLGFSPEQIAAQVDQLNGQSSANLALKPAEAEETYRAAWAWAKDLEAAEVLSWLDTAP